MTTSSLVDRTRLSLPVVPLRDMVVFPHMMAPFVVGRDSSVRALEAALVTPARQIFLVAQRDPKIDEPLRGDLFDIGVVARVVQNLRLPNGNIRVMVEGVRRGALLDAEERDGALWAELEAIDVRYPLDDRVTGFMEKVLASFEQYAKMAQQLAVEGLLSTLKLDDADRFCDTLAAHLAVATAEKQSLLEHRLALRAAAAPRRPAGGRDREDESRQAHQRAGQEADGEGAEGVLPQREDQGDPPGARQEGRPRRRARRSCKRADREGRPAQAGAREGGRRS